MVITNGFTYIAFLMCLAGVLLALEKYTKWKIFNLVPPLVWIYVLNMIFCTMGLYHSKEVSAAYKALKNNLLYAMIFVMLLRCDFRKLAKLGGRMVAIFLGCSVTLFIGFVIGYPIFKGFLGHDTWGAVAGPCMLPGWAAPPTWRPCRRLCRWMPGPTAAPWPWIRFAIPCGLPSCS